MWFWPSCIQHGELLTQGKVLQQEIVAGAEKSSKRTENKPQQAEHSVTVVTEIKPCFPALNTCSTKQIQNYGKGQLHCLKAD